MTALTHPRPVAVRSIPLAWTSDLRVAGAALFGAGSLLLMAIITAEALFRCLKHGRREFQIQWNPVRTLPAHHALEILTRRNHHAAL